MAKLDLRQKIAQEALKQAQSAVETADWTQAHKSILVALTTAEAALTVRTATGG